MAGHRASFWVLVFISFLNTLFMINTHENGLKAMGQIPLQLFCLFIGVVLFFILMVRGITYVGGSEEARIEKGWEKQDSIKFFITIGILIYNILIMWFLAR